MNHLVGVLAAAADLETFCRSREWKFCFIGGIAVQRWGTPRFTQDVAITIVTGLGREEEFIDALLDQFPGRLDEARKFALERRVLLLRDAQGVSLDVALGAFPFEEAAVRRATRWKITETMALTTCSPQDLVVHKVFAARDHDWSDVESVLARQYGRLDLGQIRRELRPLLELKEDSASLPRFEHLLAVVADRLRR